MKLFWLFKRSVMSSGKISQPKWVQPNENNGKRVLKLYNSLTRNKDVFVPISGGKYVSWYSCGPTVYDAAHMGHARNYVSIDINRRLLQDYFGYNVNFVQNVTDIDDKIILRARQNFLFEKFVKEKSLEVVLQESKDAALAYVRLNLNEYPGEDLSQFVDWADKQLLVIDKTANPKFQMYVSAVRNAMEGVNNGGDECYSKIKDVVMPYLDKKFGSSVNDREVFKKLSSYWEEKFDEDMKMLNVLPPNFTTRVSEYVPEIVKFVEKIVSNGFGYATEDGSVYFDTAKFDKHGKHAYAKNQPWNKGHLELVSEGEGSLSGNISGKRSASDFALWKASKDGEPRWESPWGLGRPGWHIECSVMASDILGESIDIHSGGIDLAFPHHDNEMAQSEACFDNYQWVNYFLHTGHLHIEGQKMSKSLKNFITVQESLKVYSPRQMRLAFCLTQWNSQMDLKDSLLQEVKGLESLFGNFFKNVRALQQDIDVACSKKLGDLERSLLKDLEVAEDKVDEAFCDNLSTPIAMKALAEIVSQSNIYISKSGLSVKIEPLIAVARYVTRILGMVGIEVRGDGLGWEVGESGLVGNVEEIALPFVKCLSRFRDDVRALAIEKADSNEFLRLTDRVRNSDLLELNVSLDDRNNQGALVKFISEDEKNYILAEAEEAESRRIEKSLKDRKRKEELAVRESERSAKASISPRDMFKDSSLYSEWDEDGIPLKDAEGNAITKSMTKRLKKQWLNQEKLYKFK
ncbi:YNL247W [Zygosaccharomyces parabailii]|nr:YNL247W [Zygosaccharomyces parabailii]CDH09736.1 probable Cysteine--tRNA ligase [Zygosaccharomyces bailii ISA1307]